MDFIALGHLKLNGDDALQAFRVAQPAIGTVFGFAAPPPPHPAPSEIKHAIAATRHDDASRPVNQLRPTLGF